jgi:multiple sugar transport system permease protein
MRAASAARKRKTMLITVLALLVSALFLFPLYWITTSSIKSDREIFQKPPTMYPHKVFLDGYTEQLTGKFSMVVSARNSFIIAVCATIISFLLAVPAAYGISRFRLPGGKTLIMVFLVTQMLPSSLLLTPLFLMFSRLKLLNTYIAPILSVTTITIPFTLLVLRPMFMACPASLEESARIDGCNRFTAFLHIVMPVIKPGLVTVLCFGFVHGWNDLVYSLTFNTKSILFPMTTAIYSLMNEYGIRWNWVMAYGCILVAPPILIFVTAQKYVISGMTGGAVKG